MPRGHDPPAVHDRQAPREPVGLLEVVGGEQDREALLGGEVGDLLPHVRARLGVEAGGGLVEEQHLRAVDESHGDVELALHPTGVRAREAPTGVGEAEALQQRAHLLGQRPPAHSVELPGEREVLAAGRVGVHAGALSDHADRAAYAVGLAQHVHAGHRGGPGVGPGQRGEDLHSGGLARPVGAEQPKDRPGLHLEAKAVERAHVTGVGLDEVGRLDRRGHLNPPPPPRAPEPPPRAARDGRTRAWRG